METVRESWTDERLDDFRGEMSEFRHEVKDEFAEVRKECVAVGAEIKALQQEMSARLYSIQRTMIQFCGLMVAALIGLVATQA